MGYDMYSKRKNVERDYFRLNIWGMGWMRGVILEGDPSLGPEIYRFCSNDGFVIGEQLGRRIAEALRVYLKTHPVGSPVGKTEDAPHERAAKELIAGISPDIVVTGGTDKARTVTQEDIDIINEFIEFNEKSAPYEVW